jgi:signal transduction histidine kinase/DNA-binding response OmpR family regulator
VGKHSLFDGGGDVGAIMDRLDWAATPLGPPDAWPQSLRTIVRILLTSRYSMWMGWGPQLAFLYNDAYAHDTLGAKHPWALGRPAREVWAEIWDQIGPRLDRVVTRGEATWDEDLLLFLERSGYREETYHTFSYSPVSDDAGNIAGNLCVVTEGTERVIGARRLALLRDLAARLAQATTERDVCAAIEESLACEPRDLPFSLLYVFEDGGRRARLAAASGFSSGDALAPVIDLTDPGAPWALFDVAQGQDLVTVECPGDVPLPRGPWDVPPRQALVVPVAQQGQSAPAGAFIAGLNPYRPLDESVRSFVTLFVGQIAAGLSNARVYEEERRRAEALAAIDRAKTAFFSNVSHEFRTPLTLMLGPTEDALASGGVMEREQLETIHRNQLRLLKLVNSLLDFSRIEAGRTQATYEPTDLAALTTDLASTFRSAVERGGLAFEVDCEPLPEPIYVDRTMWENIVLNLLSNAFKFTLEGRIRVSQRWDGGRVALTVEDTGTGIPEHERTRVFERFHRVEGVRARTHEGSGIGLALVRDLVRLHGGEITVASEVGRGTAFTVTIPAGAAHLDAERIASVAGPAPATVATQAFVAEAERWLGVLPSEELPPLAEAGPADGRARILLADDNADIREYVSRLLGQRWQVETVADGRQALAAIRRSRPDLLITDVMMPELDGFGLVAALRADADLRGLPVLILSARAGEEARLEGLQAGADDYLVKPFSARELIARVEMQLLRASIRAVEDVQRRRLTDVFEQAPAAIAIMRGPDHVFELANATYLSLVGHRDIVGKPVREALPELEGQGVYELLDLVYETGEPHVGRALRLTVVTRPGAPPEEMFFDFVYKPMRDASGAVDGIAAVVFEVSELARARRDAESASRAKDEFLAMLGHELRNPLAPMMTALQLMRLRGDSSIERERVVIERQTRHLVRLVDDLLDVSRIARGKIELRLERVDLADVVAKAIEMASPLLEEREHDLSIDVPRGITIDADPARLAQVIANLLTNAAKYTEKGGRIAIRAAAEACEAVLAVRDSGIGIAPDMLPRVFDMFTQERQALDRTQGGLGLGLTIVRNLTELHGGRVEAFSDGRNAGSEFVVRLPLTAGAAADTGAAVAPQVQARGAGSGPAVLIVDDNEDAAAMLATWLESLGYSVRTAHDGLAALKAVDAAVPAIALLDIGLPVMDGYEVATRLRQRPDGESIALIAITGYGAAGFDAHLVKPVDLAALAELLEGLSSRRAAS